MQNTIKIPALIPADKIKQIASDYSVQARNDAIVWGDTLEEADKWAQEFVPADISEIARYSFVLVGELPTYDGVAWSALLIRDGKIILNVENDGNGGPNMYFPYDHNDTHSVVKEYQEAATKAFPNMRFEQADHATSILDMAYSK